MVKKKSKTVIDIKQLFTQLKVDQLDISADVLQRAKSGDGEALYEISKQYSFFNEQLAIKWCRLAAERNHGFAMYNLAKDYHAGMFGLSQNHYLAMEWYLRAANRNIFFAYEHIAKLFEYGDKDNMTDNKKALEWYYRWNPNSNEVKMLLAEGYTITKAEKDKTIAELIMESWEVLQAKKKGLKEIRTKNSQKTEEEKMEEEVNRMQRVMSRQGYDFFTKDHYKVLLGYSKEIPEESRKEYNAYREKLVTENEAKENIKKQAEANIRLQQANQKSRSQQQKTLLQSQRRRQENKQVEEEDEDDYDDDEISDDYEDISDDYTDISDDYTDISDDEYKEIIRQPIPKTQLQKSQPQVLTQVQKQPQNQAQKQPQNQARKQPQKQQQQNIAPLKKANDTTNNYSYDHEHSHSSPKASSKEEYDSDYEDDLPECTCGRLHREQEQLRNVKKRERERAEALEKEKSNFEKELETIDWLIANSKVSEKQ